MSSISSSSVSTPVTQYKEGLNADLSSFEKEVEGVAQLFYASRIENTSIEKISKDLKFTISLHLFEASAIKIRDKIKDLINGKFFDFSEATAHKKRFDAVIDRLYNSIVQKGFVEVSEWEEKDFNHSKVIAERTKDVLNRVHAQRASWNS